MRKAHRRRALIALALVAATAAWSLRRALRPARVLVLPADAARLVELAGQSRDVLDLRNRLAALGYHSVRVEGPCRPAPAWTPPAADNWYDLWRRCTMPGRDAGREVALARRPGRARALGLDEPPGLVELAEDGNALMAKGRVPEARAAWERALRSAPALPLLRVRVAEADRRLGDFLAARQQIVRAMRIVGDSPDLYDRLGDIYLDMKRPDLAGSVFEQAAGLADTSAARWCKAARVLAAAGQRARAADCARRALSRDPGSAEAKTLAARLGGKR